MFVTCLSNLTINIFTIATVLELNIKFAKFLNAIKNDTLHFMLLILKFVNATTIRMIIKRYTFLVFVGVYSTLLPYNNKQCQSWVLNK